MSRKSKHAKLTRQKLAEAGFVETAPGVFGKPEPRTDPENDDPEPPSHDVERDQPGVGPQEDGAESPRQEAHQEGVRYQLFVISYRSRPIDSSNCCAKYIEDFLVEKGFMPDDSIWFCEPPEIRQILVPEAEQRTEVYLFRILNDETD